MSDRAIEIDVATKAEGDEIRRGLADPTVRAFVRVMANLSDLQSDRARDRVIRYLDDHFCEHTPGYVSIFPDRRA